MSSVDSSIVVGSVACCDDRAQRSRVSRYGAVELRSASRVVSRRNTQWNRTRRRIGHVRRQTAPYGRGVTLERDVPALVVGVPHACSAPLRPEGCRACSRAQHARHRREPSLLFPSHRLECHRLVALPRERIPRSSHRDGSSHRIDCPAGRCFGSGCGVKARTLDCIRRESLQ